MKNLAIVRVIDDVRDYLKQRGLLRETLFCSHEEWISRGETLCTDSDFTIISMADLANISNGWTEETDAAWEDLTDFAESRGCWIERGYLWSLHFYPLDRECAQGIVCLVPKDQGEIHQ